MDGKSGLYWIKFIDENSDNDWWISFIGQKLDNYGLTSSTNNELGNVDEVHSSWMKNECSCINTSMKTN
jgi:hypothetical protein